MANIQKLVVDDGTREISICNMFGEQICALHFRPADIAIMDRFKELQTAMAHMFEPLTQISIKNDGTAETDDDWNILKQVESALIDQLNALLDTTEAADIFAKRNAFSSVGGKFFCEHIIDAIGSLIADAIREETAATQSKIEKYMPSAVEDDHNARTAPDKPDD